MRFLRSRCVHATVVHADMRYATTTTHHPHIAPKTRGQNRAHDSARLFYAPSLRGALLPDDSFTPSIFDARAVSGETASLPRRIRHPPTALDAAGG